MQQATANQFRLLIHTAAYWLLHTLRGLAPKASFWRDAQFDTIRLALVKVAARVTELVTRIKVALPSCYPDRDTLALLGRPCRQAAALTRGAACPARARPRNPKLRQPAPSAPPKSATLRNRKPPKIKAR